MRESVLDLQGRKTLVVGMARSGRSAAALCLALGAKVRCADRRLDTPPVPGCEMLLGEHRMEDFTSADLIVVSPGVPATEPHVAEAARLGVPVIGELALAAERLRAPIIAITGTNGKSTVTWFCGQLLRAAGRSTFVGGNFGKPLCDALIEEPTGGWDAVVAEVSSYQLEWPGGPVERSEPSPNWAPRSAIILNLTPDHLARHGSIENYGAMKCRLFDRMASTDIAAIPAGDPLVARLASERGGQRCFLGALPGATLEGKGVRLAAEGRGEALLPLVGFVLPGLHNRWNAAAAALLVWGLGLDAREIHLGALRPLVHRLEFVGELDHVRWINDSKATNVAAARVGIEAMSGSFVLLLGGQGKLGEDYAELAPLLASARAVLCFGETGPRIADALEGSGIPLARCASMFQALELARELARAGDSVLLSPACASFDEFRDFEDRGDRFRAWVADLIQSSVLGERERAEAVIESQKEGT